MLANDRTRRSRHGRGRVPAREQRPFGDSQVGAEPSLQANHEASTAILLARVAKIEAALETKQRDLESAAVKQRELEMQIGRALESQIELLQHFRLVEDRRHEELLLDMKTLREELDLMAVAEAVEYRDTTRVRE